MVSIGNYEAGCNVIKSSEVVLFDIQVLHPRGLHDARGLHVVSLYHRITISLLLICLISVQAGNSCGRVVYLSGVNQVLKNVIMLLLS